jgi:ammonium transporter, Amt family
MTGHYQHQQRGNFSWIRDIFRVRGDGFKYGVLLSLVIIGGFSTSALAQSSPGSQSSGVDSASLQVALDTVWVLVAGFLVFFMNAGFCMLETGFCRSKNAVNLLAKNLIVFGLSTVAFWVTGFALMFGDGNLFTGTSGFFLQGLDNSPATGDAYQGVYSSLAWAGVPLKAKFFFQLAFAGTAATIVSGAVAERIKFLAFFIFSLVLVGIAYPITGHWIWGGGFLARWGFWDFAGSTVVHSVGGWAALTGALLLGPRLGRYQERPIAMPGHNLSISALGCLILWLGWFGFNPGSTMAADPYAISHIVVTTNLAAAMGGLAATVVSWVFLTKPDLSMIINGILAGLVAITAPCAFVNLIGAALIGLVAGVGVVFSVTLLDRLQIDDPVGAISVHLVCGIWGTLAVGLLSVGPGNFSWYGEGAGPQAGMLLSGSLQPLLIQALGVLAVGAFTTVFSLAAWSVINLLVGIRVSQTEELKGLDLCEHAMESYPEFNVLR